MNLETESRESSDKPLKALRRSTKYIRRLKLSIQGDRLSLRPPRLGLGIVLGFLTFLFLTLNALLPGFHPLFLKKKANPPHAWSEGHLSPSDPFGSSQKTPEQWFDDFIESPWLAFGLSFGVFYLVSHLFRARILMDRGQNQLFKGRRPLGRLDQIARLEVETVPKVFVMHEVALVFIGGKRLSLLLYDSPTTEAIWKFAETIANFLKVPIEKNPQYPTLWERLKKNR